MFSSCCLVKKKTTPLHLVLKWAWAIQTLITHRFLSSTAFPPGTLSLDSTKYPFHHPPPVVSFVWLEYFGCSPRSIFSTRTERPIDSEFRLDGIVQIWRIQQEPALPFPISHSVSNGWRNTQEANSDGIWDLCNQNPAQHPRTSPLDHMTSILGCLE